MSDDIKKLAELAGGQYPRGVHPNAIMFYPKELDRFVKLIEKAQSARIAELQLALKAVHRHAMGRSGDRTFDQCSAALGYIDDICRAALTGGKDGT